MIKRSHPLNMTWNYVIILLTITISFYVPFALGFSYEIHSMLLMVVSLFFLGDIVIRLNSTAHQSETGDLIDTPSKVKQLYFSQPSAMIDILAAIPFSLAAPLLGPLWDWFELFKLMKIFRLQWNLNQSNYSEFTKLMVQFLNLLIYLLLYIHITGCVQYYIISLS